MQLEVFYFHVSLRFLSGINIFYFSLAFVKKIGLTLNWRKCKVKITQLLITQCSVNKIIYLNLLVNHIWFCYGPLVGIHGYRVYIDISNTYKIKMLLKFKKLLNVLSQLYCLKHIVPCLFHSLHQSPQSPVMYVRYKF